MLYRLPRCTIDGEKAQDIQINTKNISTLYETENGKLGIVMNSQCDIVCHMRHLDAIEDLINED